MTAKKPTLEAVVNDETVVEIQPNGRFAKIKSIATDPMFQLSAAVAGLVTVAVVVSRKWNEDEPVLSEDI
jgi:hypothetical protein